MRSKDEELLERAYALSSDKDAKALYRDWADTYDKSMVDGLGYITPRKTAFMLSTHLKDKHAEILDVGTGTGLAGSHLADLGYKTIDALDYSQEMLDVAAKRNIYRKFFLADLNGQLEIPENSYDALICTGTFTHAHVGASCLDELFRILKPGGVFACTVQKDVWSDEGFDAKIRDLTQAGISRTLGMIMDIYFENDEEPQGWYITWGCCK